MEENPASFHDVDARSLHIWNVSIPIEADFNHNVKKVELRDEEELSAVDSLADVFSDVLSRKNLHIIIRCPPRNLLHDDIEELADNVTKLRIASEGGKSIKESLAISGVEGQLSSVNCHPR